MTGKAIIRLWIPSACLIEGICHFRKDAKSILSERKGIIMQHKEGFQREMLRGREWASQRDTDWQTGMDHVFSIHMIACQIHILGDGTLPVPRVFVEDYLSKQVPLGLCPMVPISSDFPPYPNYH